jgi:hypothetical protein
MDAEPDGYGNEPDVRSNGVAEIFAGVLDRSKK